MHPTDQISTARIEVKVEQRRRQRKEGEAKVSDSGYFDKTEKNIGKTAFRQKAENNNKRNRKWKQSFGRTDCLQETQSDGAHGLSFLRGLWLMNHGEAGVQSHVLWAFNQWLSLSNTLPYSRSSAIQPESLKRLEFCLLFPDC